MNDCYLVCFGKHDVGADQGDVILTHTTLHPILPHQATAVLLVRPRLWIIDHIMEEDRHQHNLQREIM